MVRWAVVGVAVIALGIRLVIDFSFRPTYQVGQRVRITAVIRGNPIKVYHQTYVIVEGIAIEVPASYEVEYGDQIIVVGTLTDKVTGVRNAQFGLINRSFQLVATSPSLTTWLLKLRERWVAKLAGWLPRDEAALAAGILLGGDRGMSYQLRQDFRRVGMSHITAASGYNVSVVAGWTMWLLARWLHRKTAILLGLVSIGLYVLLAGATAAVVRAGIMAAAAWSGRLWGREADTFWLLGLTAWLMLMVNPAYIIDIGWQLSLAATFGILWFKPAGDLWTSLAAQVTTLPLILHHFGNLLVVAPIANLLLLWLVPPIMQIGAVGLVIGPATLLAWPLLRLMTWSVTVLSSLPGASLEVGQLSWTWVIGYYGLVWGCWRLWQLRRPRFG